MGTSSAPRSTVVGSTSISACRSAIVPKEFQSKMDMTSTRRSRLKVKLWTAAGSIVAEAAGITPPSFERSRAISPLNTITGEKISSLCQNCSVKFQAISRLYSSDYGWWQYLRIGC